MTRSGYPSPWPYTSHLLVCISYAAISRLKCFASMESSTAPPQWFDSRIQRQYSALGFPKNPSLYVNASPDTTSAMTFLSAGASRSERFMTYPTALNRHELSLSMTRRVATVPSSSSRDAPSPREDGASFPASTRADFAGGCASSNDAAIARASASSSSSAVVAFEPAPAPGVGAAAAGAAAAADARTVTLSPFAMPTEEQLAASPSAGASGFGGNPHRSSCRDGSMAVFSCTAAFKSPTVAPSASSTVCCPSGARRRTRMSTTGCGAARPRRGAI
eukprot:30294-Pelagococcus_subviridis.AAC.78